MLPLITDYCIADTDTWQLIPLQRHSFVVMMDDWTVKVDTLE